MAADRRAVSRMSKELERLKTDPPHGITCWPRDGMLNHLEAKLLGGEGTPYEGGVFKLEITIPNRYPFEPPDVQFITKIYHPNIDTAGRICLDVLKSPPTGSWKPAHNIHTILTSIQLLLAEPNPDDGLMAEISSEYKHQRPTFLAKAKEWTQKYAMKLVPVNEGTVSGANSALEEKDAKAIAFEDKKKKLLKSDDDVCILGSGSDIIRSKQSQKSAHGSKEVKTNFEEEGVFIVEDATDKIGSKRKMVDNREHFLSKKRKHSIEN